MKDNTVKKLVYSGLFAALVCVATMAIRIPTPLGGYINAGDALVLLAAFVLGPLWGAAAAGLGSAIADLLAGYALYAPATFVIKLLVALTAGAILRRSSGNKKALPSVLAGVLAELIMICGYFLYECFVLKYGIAALGNVPANALQAVFGIAAGSALFLAIRKTPYYKQLFG